MMSKKVLFSLGGFQFSVNDVAYKQMMRKRTSQLSQQVRLNSGPKITPQGLGTDQRQFDGEHFAKISGFDPLKPLYEMMDSLTSQVLVSGAGDNLGKFYIKEITEKSTEIADFGAGARVLFSIKLEKDYA